MHVSFMKIACFVLFHFDRFHILCFTVNCCGLCGMWIKNWIEMFIIASFKAHWWRQEFALRFCFVRSEMGRRVGVALVVGRDERTRLSCTHITAACLKGCTTFSSFLTIEADLPKDAHLNRQFREEPTRLLPYCTHVLTTTTTCVKTNNN